MFMTNNKPQCRINYIILTVFKSWWSNMWSWGICTNISLICRFNTIIVENDASSCQRHSFQRGCAYLCWLNWIPNSITKSRQKKQYKQQLNLSFEKTPECSLESFSCINLCRICFWKHWVNHPNSIYQTTQKMLTLIICSAMNQRKYRTPLTKMIGDINAENYEFIFNTKRDSQINSEEN